jgi:hypothetical protein
MSRSRFQAACELSSAVLLQPLEAGLGGREGTMLPAAQPLPLRIAQGVVAIWFSSMLRQDPETIIIVKCAELG